MDQAPWIHPSRYCWIPRESLMFTCLLCDSPKIIHKGGGGPKLCHKHQKRIDRYGDPTARKCFRCKEVIKGVDDSGLHQGNWLCDSCLTDDVNFVESVEIKPKTGRTSTRVKTKCDRCKKPTNIRSRGMCVRCYNRWWATRKRMAE